jgi:hypothetical protein
MSSSATGHSACPNTVREAKNISELPFASERCPSCFEDWFDTPAGRDGRVIPLLLLCNHAYCRVCLDEWRKTSLGCGNGCPEPPQNPDHCAKCCQWNDSHPKYVHNLPAHAYTMIHCVEVSPDMFQELVDELDGLAAFDDVFILDAQTRTELLTYFEERTYELRGQRHLQDDLAQLLDPLQGTDVDPNDRDWWAALLPAFPDPDSYGFLEADTLDEAWITTFLRTMAQRWHDACATAEPGYDHGNYYPDVSAAEFTAEGDPIWNRPIARVFSTALMLTVRSSMR